MKWLAIKGLFFLFLFCAACSEGTQLEQMLVLAGKNGKELKMALQHYEQDSLKQRAVSFLIQNMLGHGTIRYTFIDNENNIYSLEDMLQWRTDSLFKKVRSGEFRQEPPVPDLLSISSEYLIENVDLAFEVWRKYPWCKHLSFDEFCRYILPYRLKQEPLDRWRSFYYHRYKSLADSLAQASLTMEEVVFFINSRYGKKYIHESSMIPGDFPVSLIEHVGGGTCDHLALNAVQLFRAIGIPMNLDLLPYHGKVNGGHAYNSFVDETGQFYFFSPYERQPERSRWIAPLVQRISYEQLPEAEVKANKWNLLIANRYLKNVTDQYYKTVEVSLPVAQDDSIQYLATYNRGRFNVIAQSLIKNDTATYPMISCGLLYFPMVVQQQELLPGGIPFVVLENGEIEYVHAKQEITRVNGVKLYDVNKILKLGKERYVLYYWDKGWQPLKEVVSEDAQTLDFGMVPVSSLFLVYGNTFMGKMQRPFMIKAGEYIYY